MSSPRVGRWPRVWMALATTALAHPLAAHAQTAPPRPAERPAPGATAPELNPATRLPRQAPRRSGDIFAPEPPGPCPLADSDVQVTLNSVTFRGSTAVSAAELQPSYAEYIGRPQSVAVLCAIRDRAARMLFDRGILARVEIPEQRISGGALVLEVIEAKVVNVRVRGDIGPSQAAVERYVEKLRGMAPFDMSRAQRYLLLASEIPGVQVRAAVRPSTSGERGAVDIDVTVARDAVDVVANVQNLGSRAIGRWGGLVRGEIDGLTTFGESTSLTLFRTLESNEQWLVQVAETARFGGEGLVGRASFVYGESHPGGANLADLGLESQSVVGNLEASYPLVKMRARTLNVSGGFDFVNQRTDFEGEPEPLNRDRLRVAYARMEGDYRTFAFDRPVLLTSGVAIRRGIAGLGASEAGDRFLTRRNAKPDAWVVRGAFTAETAITPQLTASVRTQGQYAESTLFPFEQMSLGNLTVGRGYDPGAVLGDKGFAGAFEVRYGPISLHQQVQAAPYAFVDAGRVYNNNATASGLDKARTLRSIGAGVIFRVANRANLEFTYSHPLDSIAPGLGNQGDRVLVQLTASVM